MIKIISYNDLINLIKDFTDLDKFEVGDDIMNILEKRSGILERNIVTKNNLKEVFITLGQDYLQKLNVSMINVTQLPMLVVPNMPELDGKYFPYIHSEISHIYNSFDTVVKQKFEIRDKVENQQVLNKTISYLNKTAFTINNDVLDFILTEWNNPDSTYFNGLNKEHDILKDDKAEVKLSKQDHNSKYWRFFNTITVATAYRNSVFYLPTFADFRGRIYTLSQ